MRADASRKRLKAHSLRPRVRLVDEGRKQIQHGARQASDAKEQVRGFAATPCDGGLLEPAKQAAQCYAG